jgi:hypothetical protein
MWIAPQLRCRPGLEPGPTIPAQPFAIMRLAPPCRLGPGFRRDDKLFGYVPVTSGLHPTPDVSLRRNNRRYVPACDIENASRRKEKPPGGGLPIQNG